MYQTFVALGGVVKDTINGVVRRNGDGSHRFTLRLGSHVGNILDMSRPLFFVLTGTTGSLSVMLRPFHLSTMVGYPFLIQRLPLIAFLGHERI